VRMIGSERHEDPIAKRYDLNPMTAVRIIGLQRDMKTR